MYFTVEDDKEEKKLSHRQKQRAHRRVKKKAELVEKKKALKQAKKNVGKQQEKEVVGETEESGDENGQGRFYKEMLHVVPWFLLSSMCMLNITLF